MSHTASIKAVKIQSINALRAAVKELNERHGIKCTLVENTKPRAYFTEQMSNKTDLFGDANATFQPTFSWNDVTGDLRINAEVKESKGGKWYIAVDSWKPSGEQAQRQAPQRHAQPAPADEFIDSEIPF